MYVDDSEPFFGAGGSPVPIRLEPNHQTYSMAGLRDGWRDAVFGPPVKVDMDTVRAQYAERNLGTVPEPAPRRPLLDSMSDLPTPPLRMYGLPTEHVVPGHGIMTTVDEVFWASIDPLPPPRPHRPHGLSRKTVDRLLAGAARFTAEFGYEPRLVENHVETTTWEFPSSVEHYLEDLT